MSNTCSYLAQRTHPCLPGLTLGLFQVSSLSHFFIPLLLYLQTFHKTAGKIKLFSNLRKHCTKVLHSHCRQLSSIDITVVPQPEEPLLTFRYNSLTTPPLAPFPLPPKKRKKQVHFCCSYTHWSVVKFLVASLPHQGG